jgi:hypothetical protein
VPDGSGFSDGEKCVSWKTVLLVITFLGIASFAAGTDKIQIGAIEDVVLMPWGVKLPARIDTGAATSSLDVCDYKVKNGYVTFSLADRCGGMKIRRPLITMKTVHTTEVSESRPIIIMDVCIGSKLIKTHFTLNDRSHLTYPVLIGRKTLRGKFIVDVSSKHILPPNCLNLNLK